MSQSEVLLTAARFRVERLRAPLPGGRWFDREVVRHPGAVVILPLLDDGRIVLLRNYRPTVARELIELPAGTCEPGEALIETARRELAEETGYHAEQLDPLMAFYPSPGILDERMHVFVARKLTPGPQRLDSGEQLQPFIADWEQIAALLREKRIEDAKTLAVLLYWRFVENG